jgi:site-specific DNA-methyltransferase (adenine-specific)
MTVEPYYQDDYCTIYHGDCLELADLWTCADVLVTDPPYGIGWTRGVDASRSSVAHLGIQNDEDTSTRDAALLLATHLPAVVFGSFYAPAPARTRQVLVWHKPADSGVYGSVTGYRRDAEPVYLLDPWPQCKVKRSSVLRSSRAGIAAVTAETGHPHTKPTDLLRELIEAAPLGVVADPFMGSGTTLRAAKDLGRKAVGIEIDERYCEIASKRLAQEVLPL